MNENVSRLVRWQDRNGSIFQGFIAEFIPRGVKIPEWYIKGQLHPKGIRFKTHQYVSKRDDRYMVDCGIHIIAYTENGEPIRDVVYRLVPVYHKNLQFLR